MKILFRTFFALNVIVILFRPASADIPSQAQTADVDIPLTTYPVPGIKPQALIGGQNVILNLSVPTLQRVVLAPDDVVDATLKITLYAPVPQGGSIAIYAMSHPETANPQMGTDYDSQPLATFPSEKFTMIPAPKLPPGAQKMPANCTQTVTGLGDFARQALTKYPSGVPLLFVATPSNAKFNINLRSTVLNVTLVSHPKTAVFTPPIQPRDGVYVENRGGHLYYGDQRLRLWGVVRPQLPNFETADRIASMGFNAIRMWGPRQVQYDETTGGYAADQPGDGSNLDDYDHFYAEAKKDGLFIMSTGLMSSSSTSVVDGPPDAVIEGWVKGDGTNYDDWRKASKTAPEWVLNFSCAFDDRSFQYRQHCIKNYLTHVNPYTGKSYAQEEAIAIFELSNENAHVKRTLENGFDKWPPYFVNELQQRWNKWLTDKYHDDSGLAQAWTKVSPDESLSAGTVKLEPQSPHHAAYPEQRGSDIIRFLIEIDSANNKRLEDYARTFAPKGVGVAVIPFSYDTQYMPSAAWLYDNTQNGDVANFGMYFWDQQNPLAKPPSMYVMDSHTVEGKITAIYETMDGRPDPFRAAYPYRAASLASWEDWDAIFFHYWDGFNVKGRTFPPEAYLAATLSYISPTHYWTAVYFEKDPALLSAMAAAGQMFIRGAISPAPHPATYVIGGQSLFSFSALANRGLDRLTFSQGVKTRFEPDSNKGASFEGASEDVLTTPPTGAVAMGDQVLWDWPNSRLIIDTPTAKAYIGVPHGNYRFKDGITVGGFGNKFVSFGMISRDGKPLTGPGATTKILITAADNAKNTGFHNRLAEGDPAPPGGPVVVGKFIDNDGTPPVIVDRVPYKIWFPTDVAGHFTGYDLALRQRIDQPVSNGQLEHDGSELYAAILSIDQPGSKTIDTPPTDEAAPSAEVASADNSSGAASARPTNGAAIDVWNPLPGVKWSDPAQNIQDLLKGAGVHFDSASLSGNNLQISNTDALFKSPANIEVISQDGQPGTINVTFTQPPALADVVADYEKQFGQALTKNITGNEAYVSKVQWAVKKDAYTVNITVTEFQGTLSIVYSLSP